MSSADHEQTHRAHLAPRAGRKAQKKDAADKKKRGLSNERYNPKAFSFNNPGKMAQATRRKADKDEKRLHVPLVDRSSEVPPPVLVAVVGPPGVGKSTLIRSLVKHYTRQSIGEIKGPVTVVTGKHRRLTLFECPNDLHAMTDMAKSADLILLLIDGKYGFEMETFEFLNICQVHGFPKVMGVLTHLDHFKRTKALQKTKKMLKQRFWTEIYAGAKLFYLSGLVDGGYQRQEVHNLARFISVMKFRPLIWRNTHSYMLVDRIEDRTDGEVLRKDPYADRTAILYGYVRGTFMRPGARVCICGAGDYQIKRLTSLIDPCPLPDKTKARKLNEKQKLIYAPMGDLGDIIMDDDAMYIEIPDAHVRLSDKPTSEGADEQAAAEVGADGLDAEGIQMVRSLQNTQMAIDERLGDSGFQLFKSVESRVDGANDVTRRPAPEATDMAEGGQDSGTEAEQHDVDGDANDTDDGDGAEDGDGAGGGTLSARGTWGGIRGFSGLGTGKLPAEAAVEVDQVATSTSLDASVEVSEAPNWKAHISSLREKNLVKTEADLNKLVYGSGEENGDQSGEDSDSDNDDLFKVSKPRKEEAGQQEPDESKFAPDEEDMDNWSDEETRESIRNKFVTGDWGKSLKSAAANDEDAFGDDDDEVYGDFEDLETGEKFGPGAEGQDNDMGSSDDGEEDEDEDEDEDEEAAARRKKKEAMKMAFDAEYDGKDPQGGKKKKHGGDKGAAVEEDAYSNIDDIRARAGTQAELNRAFTEGEEDAAREKLEGYRVGTYVRMELEGIPAELLRNRDPRVPIVAGMLKPDEEQMGFIQLKLKKHRWHRRILKTNDPLIFSIGWRRFQSMPLYAMPDGMGRYRQIKYTPEHMHCTAIVYGPVTPPNTGVICFQNTRNDQSHFRVSATGTISELDRSFQVVKKLKIVGHPYKVGRNTAFIRDMFNSQLEVAKFQGATLRTVSGIRGQIKKAVTNMSGQNNAPPGAFRATFEDKVLKSDIVFLRTWCPVEPVKLYNPVTSLLIAKPADWSGMRTVRELRLEQRLAVPNKADSEYKPVVRAERRFNALKIPRKLQADLPFKSKPKLLAASKRHKGKEGYLQKRAVVLEPGERKDYAVLQQLRTIRNDKLAKRKVKNAERRAAMEKRRAKEEEEKNAGKRQERKKRYAKEGAAAARAKKKARFE